MYEFFHLCICNASHLIITLWFVPLIWFFPMLWFYIKWRPRMVEVEWRIAHAFDRNITIEKVNASIPNAFLITLPRWFLTIFAWGILLCIAGTICSAFGVCFHPIGSTLP
jgi:hypothetical protein